MTKKPMTEGKLERRQRLIEATIAAIARYGLNHVTLDKVAKLAGLVAGTVNFHFNGKEELLLESARSLAESFLTRLQMAMANAAEQPAQTLRQIADLHVDEVLSSQERVLAWYSFWVEINDSDAYRHVCVGVDQEYLAAYRQLCQLLLQQHGHYFSAIQVEALARGIAGMMNQVWEEVINDDSAPKRQELQALYQAFFASIFPWAFELAKQPMNESLHQPIASLPAIDSTSADSLSREQAWLWQFPQWCVATLPSAQHTYQVIDVANESVLWLNKSGNRSAFFNVCAHHPHAVTSQQQGRWEQSIPCEWGWHYDEHGHLMKWPSNVVLTLPEQTALSLTPLTVNELGLPMVSVQAASVPQILTQLVKTGAGNTFVTQQRDVNANWKTILDVLLSVEGEEVVEVDETVWQQRIPSQNATLLLWAPNKLVWQFEQGVGLLQCLPLATNQSVVLLAGKWPASVSAFVEQQLVQAEKTQQALTSRAAKITVLQHAQGLRRYWHRWMLAQRVRQLKEQP